MGKIVRAYLIFGGIYMLGEAVIHFYNVKLTSVQPYWPSQALSFSSWISILYASTCIFLSMLLLFVQSNIKENKKIIKLLAFYALFHGGILSLAIAATNFDQIFAPFPSLSFWIPFYNEYLFFEAVLLFIFSFLIFIWLRKS